MQKRVRVRYSTEIVHRQVRERNMNKWHLSCDVGGTNARFAVINPEKMTLEYIANFKSTDFYTFEHVVEHFLKEVEHTNLYERFPTKSSLGVAGDVTGENIRFTNTQWTINKLSVTRILQSRQVLFINDFTACAASIPLLEESDVEKIGGGDAFPLKPISVLGPGTGFGIATVAYTDKKKLVILPGEGGHADFAPTDETQLLVRNYLASKYDRLSIERLLSGKGLLNIYEALSNIRATPTKFHTSIDIGTSALRGDDPICTETFEIFFAILGSVAGNQALTVGSQGGVYIAGGIAPQYLDLLKRSPFREKFIAKGRMAHYLRSIPTFVITHKNPGLIGAASLLTND